jgi:hypothetical protein
MPTMTGETDWKTSSSGSVVTVEGTCLDGTTKTDITVKLNIAETPNMPRFKHFKSGGSFKLTYFDD